MCEETKRIVDVLLTVVATVGAVIAFAKAVHEWQISQKWKRAEHLQNVSQHFDRLHLVFCVRVANNLAILSPSNLLRLVALGGPFEAARHRFALPSGAPRKSS